ncbi:unnamed protein product [Coregonus sp. 'balchen']|nr:unnamed protein product [Coregonus sp. 'balchen']
MMKTSLVLWMCGTVGFGFGVFLMMNSKVSSLIPSLSSLNLANMFFITGIIMTCVSFLGFLGAMKENRCLLITGCYIKLKAWFENNFLATGVAVIVLCIVEVLGMCFSVTLSCHISQSGLSYK